jgi:hypothetical protein
MPGGERRKPNDIEDRRTKVKVTTSKNRTKIRYFFVSAQYLKYKKLSIHMPHAERNKSHQLKVCGSKVKITIHFVLI